MPRGDLPSPLGKGDREAVDEADFGNAHLIIPHPSFDNPAEAVLSKSTFPKGEGSVVCIRTYSPVKSTSYSHNLQKVS